MNKDNFLLGIVGGMGPRVLIPFCNKLINLNNVNKEQEHIPFIAISDPTIEDRTKSILDNDTNIVLEKLNSFIKKFNSCEVTHIIMLCNTVHYWKPYLNLGNIKFIDILGIY